MRSTHTYAELRLSPAAYKEIAEKLKEAGYDHAFMENGVIDMHGIGVSNEDPELKQMLFGSDILPSMVTIKRGERVSLVVQLGTVVRKGFERTGISVWQWNRLPSTLRDAILAETVEFMATEI